ncbi:MAG: hypothetical protein J1F02_06655 [Lachnospiraceae bacterium]|nr:hypothetical protein [Lachnospiraceae bacterium]
MYIKNTETAAGAPARNKAKTMAALGIMAAAGTVMMVLGTVISINTLFFTAAAAFLTGIAVVTYGVGYGTVYLFVCGALDFLVNPNKLHVFLYLAMAGYLLLAEGTYRGMKKFPDGRKKEWLHRGIRLALFAALYLPVLIYLSRLFVSEQIRESKWFFPVMLPAGLLAWLVYDLAYSAVKKIFHERFGKLFGAQYNQEG